MTTVGTSGPASSRPAAIFGFIDQALSSATNFAAVIVAATILDVKSFGYYSMAYVVYVLVLGATQALISQAMVILPDHVGVDARSAMYATSGLGAVAGLMIGCGAVFLVPEAHRGVFYVLAIGLPLLLSQDVLRTVAAMLKTPQTAAISDAVWLVTYLVGVYAAKMGGVRSSAPLIMGCWVMGGVIGGLVAAILMRSALRKRSDPLRVLGSTLGMRFLLEYAITQGANQASIVAIGGVAGPSATGSIRGATALYGPAGMLISAIPILLVPPLRNLSGRAREGALIGLSLGLAGFSMLLMLVLISVPDEFGRRLLGETWSTAQPLILPVGLQFSAIAVGTVGFTALRLSRPRRTLPIKGVGSVVFLIGFWGGYYLAGVDGAVWGLFFGSAVQAAIAWLTYWVSLQQIVPPDRLITD